MEVEPAKVDYCQACGWPVQYCRYRSRTMQKSLNCAQVLRDVDPELWSRIYPELANSAAAQPTATPEAAHDTACDNAEHSGEEGSSDSSTSAVEAMLDNTTFKLDPSRVPLFGMPVKPYLKRRSDFVPVLQIRLAKRGGKKVVTQIFGYEDFDLDTKQFMSTLRKQCASSVGFSNIEPEQAEIITIQGKYLELVKALAIQMGVPLGQIFFATDAKHKGRKRK